MKCAEPGCLRPAAHPSHPHAHVKRGSTVEDANSRRESRIP